MISVHRILYLYVIVSVVFTEVYVVFPWMQAITIMNYILVASFLLYNRQELNRYSYNLQIYLFIFIGYIFLVNLLQNDLQKTVSILITTLPIPFIFGIFSKYPDRNKLIFFYAKFYIIYNAFFSLLQIIGLPLTASSIISKIPLFGTYREFVGLSAQALRISGAGASTISLACVLGLIFLLFYFYKENDQLLSKRERFYYLFGIVVLIMLTQTRSVIFALPIVVFVSNLIMSEKKIHALYTTLFGLIGFVVAIYFLLPIMESIFPRLFLSLANDGSVVHRIQANVYGAIGTYEIEPWFGVPFSDALHAMHVGYKELGLFVGTYFINEVTYHNQLFYHFRHYGFIGLFLYLLLYWKIIQYALKSNFTEYTKKILISMILFYFLYTLSHNNKWTMDYYLWVLLAFQVQYFKQTGKIINEKE